MQQTIHPMRERLVAARRFVMIGVGGAGMSGVARLLAHRGLRILGYDGVDSAVMDALNQEGIEAVVGHGPEAFEDGDVLIVSDAVDRKEHSSVIMAEREGIPIVRRSEALGWLLEGRKTIAITGSHGKTTTTGFVGKALEELGLDPLIVAGAELIDYNSSVRIGQGEFAVIEACEAYDSLRDFDPHFAVLTNLEFDHSHTHANYQELEQCVRRFLERVPDDGFVLVSEPSRNLAVLDGLKQRIETYSSSDVPSDVTLPLPGEHNRENAAAAVKIAEMLGESVANAVQSLTKFSGPERRLQHVWRSDSRDIDVYDDYAHHPTEIRASIQGLREFHPSRRIVVVYQPHLYSRTRDFLDGFVDALNDADFVVMNDIYPAREPRIPGITSLLVQERLSVKSKYVPSRHLLPLEVGNLAEDGDVVVMMGAGTINLSTRPLIEWLEAKSRDRSLRIAVIAGGDSAEREVSLAGGEQVLAALKELGYDVFLWDPAEELHGSASVSEIVSSSRPDLAFIVTHGPGGEDGATQGLLELLRIPYTGSGLFSSAAAMNKAIGRDMLAAAGIPIPRGVCVVSGDGIELDFDPPVYVKPCSQGSTVGGGRADIYEEIPQAVERALNHDSCALIEELLEGVELSCPVLDGEAFPCVEIVPSSGHYDFAMKYQIGATEEICPARIDSDHESAARDLAVRAYAALKCKGLARVDMILTEDRGPVVLEINTIPGMTSTSLVRKGAEGAGVSFVELVERMVRSALSET